MDDSSGTPGSDATATNIQLLSELEAALNVISRLQHELKRVARDNVKLKTEIADLRGDIPRTLDTQAAVDEAVGRWVNSEASTVLIRDRVVNICER